MNGGGGGVLTRDNQFNGIFYPKYPQEIIDTIKRFFYQIEISPKDKERLDILAKSIKDKRILTFIVPHGSYFYSGYISSFVYYLISLTECNNFIIISPDHNGTSPGVSIMDKGCWRTPLGSIGIDENLGIELLNNNFNNLISVDPFSLTIDHAIETQLPFLQYIKRNGFKFMPILQRKQDKYTSIKLAEILYSSLPKGESVILIVTSNFSHYLGYDECYKKDHNLISDVLSLNIDSFYKTFEDDLMTVCGFGCIASAMELSKKTRNLDVVLLKYLTSGDIDGNKSSVVGYSSLLML
ncbi:MAG: AmmeMemoRadiSam system protein B [Thermoproteota archaeon]|nr:AmmeMemoRadiSam system protein B [Thermoproteota archaeon]